MAFNAIEIIALVFVLAGLVKIFIILVKRNSWASFVKSIYSKPNVLMLVELVLAGIVLYYLSQSGLTIVQIMACVVLGALLTGMTFAAYGKELISPMIKLLKTNAWKKAWIPILVWIILMVWTLGKLFNLF